jgi:hypothetical protein
MNKLLLAVFLAITILFINPFEGYAGKTNVFVSAHYKTGYGHGWGNPGRWRHYDRGPRFYWGGSFVVGPGYPYGYYPPPPVIIQQQPPVYVQPEQPEDNYWYYCRDPEGFYPYVRNCADGWMKVVPDATPPNP